MPDLFVAPTTPKKPEDSGQTQAPQQTSSAQDLSGKTILATPTLVQKNHKIGLLTGFMQNPQGIHFASQENGEQILIFLRRHPFTNFRWTLLTAILSIAPLLIPLLIPLINLPFITIPARFALILLLFYYLIIFGYAYISYITWFFNIGIITQKRVIDIDYRDVVYQNVAATRIKNIEDVNYTQSGFFSTFFDYGDVYILTAADVDNFDFHSVPKPRIVVDTVHDLMGQAFANHGQH